MPPKNPKLESTLTPLDSARHAGLHYVTDGRPGISRLGVYQAGEAPRFRYMDANSRPIQDPKTLARIKALVIPPAWTEVWICPEADGHLQVTGRDARGRKQSRYHPHWRQVRDETKYERMMHFGAALPAIRKRVDHDLARPGLPREKVLATVIRLMELTHIRVGNEEYARENHSYGLTTLENRHVHVDGTAVQFKFRGKSGVEHAVGVTDRRLARIIRDCQHIPGHELFQYVDRDGSHHTIHSTDVNDYLRSITTKQFPEAHFTAKDFRTWAGSVLACTVLRQFDRVANASQAKKNVVAAIKEVASHLGNTPSVCRKCYVHPQVLDAYLNGKFIAEVKAEVASKPHTPESLHPNETDLLELLGRSLTEQKPSRKLRRV